MRLGGDGCSLEERRDGRITRARLEVQGARRSRLLRGSDSTARPGRKRGCMDPAHGHRIIAQWPAEDKARLGRPAAPLADFRAEWVNAQADARRLPAHLTREPRRSHRAAANAAFVT